MATVSVIVPVYKVEPYLCRCVDSILSQSFPDFELILVDDGSPDNCGAICDEYARNDGRIHVIHQENGGLSAARNAGIDWVFAHSDSQWLTFIDSDDWIHPKMLEVLLSAAKENQTEIAVCGYARTGGEPVAVSENALTSEVQMPEDYWQNDSIATIACAKLYARECFASVRYPVGKVHEDEFVTYRLLFAQNRIAVVPAPLYAYYVNQESITQSAWAPRRLAAWEALDQQLAFFEEIGNIRMYRFTLRNYLANAMNQFHELEATPEPERYAKEKQLIEAKIRQLLQKNWEYKQIRFWWDYEFLRKFYPVRTQLYRIYLSVRKRLGMKYESE